MNVRRGLHVQGRKADRQGLRFGPRQVSVSHGQGSKPQPIQHLLNGENVEVVSRDRSSWCRNRPSAATTRRGAPTPS